jgi:hypothetical protein
MQNSSVLPSIKEFFMLQMNQQIELLRSFLDERLAKSLRAQEIEQTQPRQLSWKQKLYWRGGELLIAVGENLKCQVQQQACGQITVVGHS